MKIINRHQCPVLVKLMSHIRLLFLLSLTAILGGCISDNCSDCTPPKEAVAEMVVLGATITTDTEPFPNSVNQYFIPNGVESAVSGQVVLYFAPHPEFEVIENFYSIDREPARNPYEFSFSQLTGGQYIELPSKSEYEQNDPEHFYYGYITLDDEPLSLTGSANHLLKAWPVIKFPVKATHVELWHRSSENSEKMLVRRIPLDSFYAWRRYFMPLIEENCIVGC